MSAHDHDIITAMVSLNPGKNDVRESVAWTVAAVSMVLFVI